MVYTIVKVKKNSIRNRKGLKPSGAELKDLSRKMIHPSFACTSAGTRKTKLERKWQNTSVIVQEFQEALFRTLWNGCITCQNLRSMLKEMVLNTEMSVLLLQFLALRIGFSVCTKMLQKHYMDKDHTDWMKSTKALSLSNDPDAILKAASVDPRIRTLKSRLGKVPLIVKLSKTGNKLECQCSVYKAVGTCQDTITVAEDLECLEKYAKDIQKKFQRKKRTWR